MDLQSSPSSIGSAGPSFSTASRRERGAIAAQACETCRTRKQRCDERRPRCSTCQKFKLNCNYREPQPTKRDKTLVQILERLKSVEDKLDTFSSVVSGEQSPSAQKSPRSDVYQGSPLLEIGSESISNPSLLPNERFGVRPSSSQNEYWYAASTSALFNWPIVRCMLESIRRNVLDTQDSSSSNAWLPLLAGLPETRHRLPTDGIDGVTVSPAISSTMSLHFMDPGSDTHLGGVHVISWDTIQTLSTCYFDTFNLVHPILDREAFMLHSLDSVVSGFDFSSTSGLVLLVMALGEVALTSGVGHVTAFNEKASNVEGHSLQGQGGLALFNEARKRLGLFLTEGSIENVQMLSLTALYYASCGRAADCWRACVYASLACHALINVPSHVENPENDIIRRLYWHCFVNESCLRTEFKLPTSDTMVLSPPVSLPTFTVGISKDDYMKDHTFLFEDHFASQLSLHRLLLAFNASVHDLQDHVEMLYAIDAPSNPPTGNITIVQMQRFASQLELWRNLLPTRLKWQDQPTEHSDYDGGLPLSNNSTLSLDDQGFSPRIDVARLQTALLRSRYYYVRYLIHRPYVYKVLHDPNNVTQEDAAGATMCLQSCLRWPILTLPASSGRKLISLPFFWSQTLTGVLLILHLSLYSQSLHHIRATFGGQCFEDDATETVNLILDWLRDWRRIDATTERCWRLIRSLYGLEE